MGDPRAYELIVEKYQAKIRGFCLYMLSDKALAEDAAQDVFIKAFQSLQSFRRDASFSTWLHRIARNRCLDLLRSKKRKRTESWDALLEQEGAQAEKLHASSQSPLSEAEHRDLLQKLLAGTRENYREILVLKEVQGLSYQEISEVLEVSLDSVKAQLKRARKAFQERLRHISKTTDVSMEEVK